MVSLHLASPDIFVRKLKQFEKPSARPPTHLWKSQLGLMCWGDLRNASKQKQWPKPASWSGISVRRKTVINTWCPKADPQASKVPGNSFSKAHSGFNQVPTSRIGNRLFCMLQAWELVHLYSTVRQKRFRWSQKCKTETMSSLLLIHSRTGESCFPHSAEAAAKDTQRAVRGGRSGIAKISNTNIRTASATHALPAGKAAALLSRHSERWAVAKVIETEMNTGNRFPRRASLAEQLQLDLLPLYYKNIKTYSLLNSTCKWFQRDWEKGTLNNRTWLGGLELILKVNKACVFI